MTRNIEIKVRIESVEALAVKVATFADQCPVEIIQYDTFFKCERGRLKLRVFFADAGKLIFYQRPNQTGARRSHSHTVKQGAYAHIAPCILLEEPAFTLI